MSVEDRLRELDPTRRRPEDGPEPPWKREERTRLEREYTAIHMAAIDDAKRIEGLPELLAASMFGELQETPALAALADVGGVVVLSGGVGCGKSLAAAVWLLDGQLVRLRGAWLTAARLARFPRYDSAKMDELLTVPRLVLDDLGDEYLDEKGAYLSLLDELINERHGNKRPTVLTTNLSARDFKVRYGERIADRIRESGRFESVDGPSLRKKGAGKAA